jgi:hypothetical protein
VSSGHEIDICVAVHITSRLLHEPPSRSSNDFDPYGLKNYPSTGVAGQGVSSWVPPDSA